MNITPKTQKEVDEDYIERYVNALYDKMDKKIDNECCVCYEIKLGIKLPNCNHYVCTTCHYKLYNGYLGENFYIINPRPIKPQTPVYPYLNITANSEIYHALIINNSPEKDWFTTEKDWFIEENEDLYNCVKTNSEYANYVDPIIKRWFENNEQLLKYENDSTQYELDNIKYRDEYSVYCDLCEEERTKNIQGRCPLCRL